MSPQTAPPACSLEGAASSALSQAWSSGACFGVCVEAGPSFEELVVGLTQRYASLRTEAKKSLCRESSNSERTIFSEAK